MKFSAQILIVLIAILMASALTFAGWKLERWLNWKFDYGARVELRIKGLENRIDALERGVANGTPIR